MTDRLDDLLFSIGEEQNGGVDFDRMYADLLQRQKEEESRRGAGRSKFLRYSAMAACAVMLIGIGAAMLRYGGLGSAAQSEAAITEECAEEAAPEAPAAAPEAAAAAATDAASPPISGPAEEERPMPAPEAAPSEGGEGKLAASGAAEPEGRSDAEDAEAAEAVDEGAPQEEGAPEVYPPLTDGKAEPETYSAAPQQNEAAAAEGTAGAAEAAAKEPEQSDSLQAIVGGAAALAALLAAGLIGRKRKQ